MWLLDQWAERHIVDAQARGEFDNLPGEGEPLELDDDSQVAPELRAGYRLLKNSGCLPPELELRREAIVLKDLLTGIHRQHPDYVSLTKKLALLKLRLNQAGISSDFLEGDYAQQVQSQINREE